MFLIIALVISKFSIVNRGEIQFRKKRIIQDELFKCYKSIIDGYKELNFNKARKSEFLGNRLSQHAKEYRDTTIKAELFWNLANNWNNGVVFIGIGALIFISTASAVATATLMMHFIVVILYMIGPITVLMNSFQSIYNAKVSVEKVASLQLDVNGIESSEYHHESTAKCIEKIEYDAVEFSYSKTEFESSAFSVGPISLSVSKGEMIFLVGGNGSGKTTIAKVLSGLFYPTAGEIRVNGKAITKQSLSKFYDYFSTIFQDYYLFEEIINKSGAAIDTAEVEQMLTKLGLFGKVEIKDGRLLTTKLSYGQRKRLALLLAYFEDSEIYIFDEWAADQDPEFREFFYREFLMDLKDRGKTIFVISHDERYFDCADRVVKFERGTIHSIVDGCTLRNNQSSVVEV
jgi:cyclic peptide transporter